jgi:two-component sensor histidine kinase
MPLALVLNELLTNAAKHGTNDRGRVNINVRLSSIRDRTTSMCRTADLGSTLRRPKGGHRGSAWWRRWRKDSREPSRWSEGLERVAL